ncbi:MAG: hypothetical protein FJ026_08050 [Chloroflexi bacterium]|nr:hypothetical protein [Chloroflexota bacterium]
MHKKSLIVVLCILVLALAWIGDIEADVSHDPAAPIPIPYDQALDFALLGNGAGSFAFYSIEYPGDGRVITIQLDLAPGDPVAMMGAGFHVYGPYGYLIGTGAQDIDKLDRKVVLWSDYNPARWLIQVYNYLPGTTVNFHLEVRGLPGPQPTRAPVMLPAEATTFSLASGSLLGDRGGNYHYYKLDCSGSGAQVVLYLFNTPDNHLVSEGFGVNVYGPDGTHYPIDAHYVRFKCHVPGTYLIQVYNYLHAINVSYVLVREQ